MEKAVKGNKMLEKFFPDLILDFLLIGLPLLYCYGKNLNFFKEIKLQAIPIAELGRKTAHLLAALIVVSFALSALLSVLQANDLEKVRATIELLRQKSMLIFVYLLIVRVVSEEIFFRGFLVNKIGKLGSTILFGLAHAFYGSIAEITGALILGYLLAHAYEKNQNLLPNIFAHIVYNWVVIALMVGGV